MKIEKSLQTKQVNMENSVKSQIGSFDNLEQRCSDIIRSKNSNVNQVQQIVEQSCAKSKQLDLDVHLLMRHLEDIDQRILDKISVLRVEERMTENEGKTHRFIGLSDMANELIERKSNESNYQLVQRQISNFIKDIGRQLEEQLELNASQKQKPLHECAQCLEVKESWRQIENWSKQIELWLNSVDVGDSVLAAKSLQTKQVNMENSVKSQIGSFDNLEQRCSDIIRSKNSNVNQVQQIVEQSCAKSKQLSDLCANRRKQLDGSLMYQNLLLNYYDKFPKNVNVSNSREFDQSKEEIEESCPNQIFSESVINLNGSFLSKIKNKAQNVKTIIIMDQNRRVIKRRCLNYKMCGGKGNAHDERKSRHLITAKCPIEKYKDSFQTVDKPDMPFDKSQSKKNITEGYFNACRNSVDVEKDQFKPNDFLSLINSKDVLNTLVVTEKDFFNCNFDFEIESDTDSIKALQDELNVPRVKGTFPKTKYKFLKSLSLDLENNHLKIDESEEKNILNNSKYYSNINFESERLIDILKDENMILKKQLEKQQEAKEENLNSKNKCLLYPKYYIKLKEENCILSRRIFDLDLEIIELKNSETFRQDDISPSQPDENQKKETLELKGKIEILEGQILILTQKNMTLEEDNAIYLNPTMKLVK
ncbi:Spectrin beta brain [Brachionus plicatilis]|uniref:Spectrin beta brain n=1 Tax=Brachionus plicatilis TaxID=10195 RepID=A0A3M7SFU9_BRAPC|nr:Spectrin beta brain [Brachionus plicatilis]